MFSYSVLLHNLISSPLSLTTLINPLYAQSALLVFIKRINQISEKTIVRLVRYFVNLDSDNVLNYRKYFNSSFFPFKFHLNYSF